MEKAGIINKKGETLTKVATTRSLRPTHRPHGPYARHGDHAVRTMR